MQGGGSSPEGHARSSARRAMTKLPYLAHAPHTHSDHPTGWRRYVYATNHKDIGTMYLMFALVAGVIGWLLSVGMRAELQEPGLQIFSSTHAYNVFVSAHGLIMIFFTLMPAQIG